MRVCGDARSCAERVPLHGSKWQGCGVRTQSSRERTRALLLRLPVGSGRNVRVWKRALLVERLLAFQCEKRVALVFVKDRCGCGVLLRKETLPDGENKGDHK